MKYIVDIDGVESTRHTYNVWSVLEYDDGSVAKDTRIFETDDHEKFITFMSKLQQPT